ncbi:MAG: dienelactone hydrolase family protein, partial [Pseudomonadota bacterium]
RAARWAGRYDRVVVSGFSLGSGIASLHAAHAPPEAALLFAPFRDFAALVRSKGGLFPRALFRTDFDNAALLTASGAPVTIVLGERDKVIPAEISRDLAAHVDAQVVAAPDAGHNDLIGAVNLDQVLARALSKKQP